MLGARVIDDKARFEVVKRVKNEIDISDIVFDVCRIDIVHPGFDLDRRIHASQLRFCSCGFRKIASNILLIEQRLALQVRQLHEISINQPHKSHACANDLIGRDTPKRP